MHEIFISLGLRMLRLSYIVLSLFLSLNSWAEINDQNSLKTIGYPNGINLKNNANVKMITFSLPDQKLIKQAIFNIEFEYAQNHMADGQLDVSIENKLLLRIPLRNEPLSNEIILKQTNFKIPDEYLKRKNISLQFELSSNIKNCEDETQDAKQSVHIKPSTQLTLSLHQSPMQINDFFITLPEIVSIQLPGRTLTANEFENIALLSLYLNNSNKVAKFTTYNSQQAKHVIFGNQEELAKNFNVTTTHFIDLAPIAGKTSLLINSSLALELKKLLNFDIEILNQKNITTIPASPQIDSEVNMTIKIPEEYEYSLKGQRWTLLLKNHQLPGAVVAKTARIQLTTPPSTNGTPILLFLYLDQMLVHAQELEANGKLEDLSIELPQQVKKHGSELTLQVMRSDIARTCGGDNNQYLKSQLGSKSALEFTSFNKQNDTLAEFALASNRSVTLSVPTNALEQKINWLPHIQLVLNSIAPKYSAVNFDFYTANPKNDIASAQIVFTNFSSELMQDKLPTDIKDLRNLFVFRLANYQDKPVLFYQTSSYDLAPMIDSIQIDDSHGIVFEQNRALKSLQPHSANEDNKTKEIIGELEFNIRKYRYYIFAVLWLVLTLAFIRIGKSLK